MQRVIIIIGSPGAGKSTFARRLGQRFGREVIHLDRLFWRPGWVATPRPGKRVVHLRSRADVERFLASVARA